MPTFERQHQVTEEQAGQRLDQLLASIWSDFSRNRLAQWVKSGDITLNERVVKPRQAVSLGDCVALQATLSPHSETLQAEDIELDVLYADEAAFVINKPAHLVVHPGSGNPDGTLANALLHLDPALEALPRAGLVHRLDKDTTGCLMVARTHQAHTRLVALLKDREIKRRYVALVWGRVLSGGTINEPMGRHPTDRRKQVVRRDGRPAITHYRLNQHLAGATLLDVELETGRTHQIRVHMAHVGYPIIGDPVYGRRGSPGGLTEAQRAAWQQFPRQALHASQLVCPHPIDEGKEIAASAPIPDDLQALMRALSPEPSND